VPAAIVVATGPVVRAGHESAPAVLPDQVGAPVGQHEPSPFGIESVTCAHRQATASRSAAGAGHSV